MAKAKLWISIKIWIYDVNWEINSIWKNAQKSNFSWKYKDYKKQFSRFNDSGLKIQRDEK